MKTRTISRILATAAIALPSALFAIDSDSDGLDDSVETNTGTYVSPTNTGTNPNNPDSDADGAGDWYEVATIDRNPLIAPPNAPNNAAIKPNIPYPLPAPDASTGVTHKPVKVYILSGQSNMVGHGEINPQGTAGTLSTITRNQNKFPNLLNGANWSVRNDVKYRGVIAAIGNASLTAGQGNTATTIGPELGFGHVMGYYHDEPVLVLKSSEGGKSLGGEFLPPGSVQYTYGSETFPAFGESPVSWATGSTPVPNPAFYGGIQFDKCFRNEADWAPAGAMLPAVTNVTDVLDNFATEYPQWAAQGFEIAGFCWFHGWNDGLSYTGEYAYRYEQNMAQFIRKIREYYVARYPGKIQPKAPFVIATAAFEGLVDTYNNQYPTRRAVFNAQLAVGDPLKYPEFANNVKTLDARPYWRTQPESPANQQFHYHRNAETYMLVGDALGRGMIDLLGTAGPDTAPPALFNTHPLDNAANVPADGDLTAAFNENVSIGTGDLTLRNLTDSSELVIPVADDEQVSVSGSTLTVDPAGGLVPGKSYALRIAATAITDLAGNPFPGIADDTTWNFTATSPDTAPPTPDPITWATPPTAISSTAITMAATNASDPNGVQYYFTCTSGGGHDSGWQNGAAYTDTGLLPSTTCTYTVKTRDSSPNANQGSTSASASATTQSRPGGAGGAIVYEPFDDPEPLLSGNTSGLGLSGPWSAAIYRFAVDPGSLTWGAIPTSGRQVRYLTTGDAASSVALSPALGNAGLLANGATLWFSVLVNTPADTGSAPDTGFAIGSAPLGSANNLPIAAGEQAIGWTIKNDKLQSTTWNGGNAARGATGPAIAPNTLKLIVGKITWGANSSANDTINLYTPDANLALGSSVVSSTAVLNQTNFDTLAVSLRTNTNTGFGFDEIRFGASYNDVIGQNNTFGTWAAGYSLGALNGFNDDPDGDGIASGIENHFGTHPGIKSPGLTILNSSPGSFTFTHPLNAIPATDVIGGYRWSTDMQTFHDGGQANAGGTIVSFTQGPPVSGIVTVQATVSGTPANRLFVAIRVIRNP
jgi:alpha-galactosidase